MGKSQKTLTSEQKAQVEALAACLSIEQIADYFGISKVTFYAMMDREPEISERYKRGKSNAISGVANSLLTKAKAGDTASAIFYLKTQAGWRETAHIEHTGKDGGAIEHKHDLTDLPDEVLSQLTSAGLIVNED